NSFRSNISFEKYLQSEYPYMDMNKFFASFSWMIPSMKSPSSKGIVWDICCSEPGFFRDCAIRGYMTGKVGGSINLDAQYLCRYCDSRMDLVAHALMLINTYTFVSSFDDIEKILNVGIRILRGSQKEVEK
ncbi:hypothetical protein EJD97_025255, partial [Solanum chilense]